MFALESEGSHLGTEVAIFLSGRGEDVEPVDLKGVAQSGMST